MSDERTATRGPRVAPVFRGALCSLLALGFLACQGPKASTPQRGLLQPPGRTEAGDGISGGAAADRTFLGFYAEAQQRAVVGQPVALLVMPGEIYLVKKGQVTRSFTAAPPIFVALKDISHVALGLFVAIYDAPTAQAAAAARRFAPEIEVLEQGLGKSVLAPMQRPRQRLILAACRNLIVAAGQPGGVSSSRLRAFTQEMKKPLLENAAVAARVQLEHINRVVTEVLAEMSPAERAALIVVVGSSHQAYADNLQLQYFRALLGPSAAEDRRLIFGEGVFKVSAALDLLGAHLLDRAASDFFFGSPLRLQRDLLGDAAARIVPTLKIPPIAGPGDGDA